MEGDEGVGVDGDSGEDGTVEDWAALMEFCYFPDFF